MANQNKRIINLPAGDSFITGSQGRISTPVDISGVTYNIDTENLFNGGVIGAVIIAPAAIGLVLGFTQALKARTYSADGNELFSQTLIWASSDITIATVDVNGVVTPVGVGNCNITATSNTNKIGTCAITVEVSPFDFWYRPWHDTFASIGGTYTGDAGTYWDVNGVVTLAPANTVRENHWVNGRRVLLTEGTFENGLLWSEDITNAVWVKTSCSVAGSTIKGPDGVANSGQGIIPVLGVTNLAAATLHLTQNVNSLASGPHSLGRFVHKGSASIYLLQYTNKAGNAVHKAWFNLITGKVGTEQGLASAYIQPLANGWFWCGFVQGASDAGAAQAKFNEAFVDTDGTGSFTITGDGTTVAGYVWGASSNTSNNYPGSYVKTTNATVTRASDSCIAPIPIVPAPRSFYLRYTDFFQASAILDGSQAQYLISIDGIGNQGTHYDAFYFPVTTGKINFFSNTYAAGNVAVVTQALNATVPGDREEVRVFTSVTLTKMMGSNQDPHTGLTFNGIEWVFLPVAEGGSYSGAFGTGTVNVFFGQKSGGSNYSPMCLEEFKVISGISFTDLNTSRFRGISRQPIWSMSVTPSTANIGVGDTLTAIPTATDFLGAIDTPNRILSWGSSDTTVATVDQFGKITAIAAGDVNISVSCEGQAAYVRLTVRAFT